MRGSYHNYILNTSRLTKTVEDAAAKHKEECEQRLARIQNGKEPSHKNGPWPGQKPGEVKE
jgi:hypothetical protein